MSTNPISPRLLRGAILGFDVLNPLASVIVFQYNPDTMSRRIEARAAGNGGYGGFGGGDRTEALRLAGPPQETISVAIEVDAADQLGGSPVGVHPPLAALEMLLYPKSALVIANLVLSQLGLLEIGPPEAPLTLFFWGPARVLPVRITSLNITEEQFDPLLNPTRAKVDVSMQVLSYQDLKIDNPGHWLFIAHQITKEVLAVSNVAASAVNLGASLKVF